MKTANPRFRLFQSCLWNQLGTRCDLLASGGILIHANEFSTAERFASLQAAIDRFARYMPQSLLG